MIEVNGKEYWQGLLDREVRPMTREESELFMRCMMIEMRGLVDHKNLESMVMNDARAKILISRTEMAGTKLNIPLVVYLCDISRTPAQVVMWAYTVHMMRLIMGLGNRTVGIQDLAEAFPMGFPADDAYREAWDGQKVSDRVRGSVLQSDNMVDNYDNWPSEQV